MAKWRKGSWTVTTMPYLRECKLVQDTIHRSGYVLGPFGVWKDKFHRDWQVDHIPSGYDAGAEFSRAKLVAVKAAVEKGLGIAFPWDSPNAPKLMKDWRSESGADLLYELRAALAA